MKTDIDLYHQRLEEAMFDKTGIKLAELCPCDMRTVLEVGRDYSTLMLSIAVRLDSASYREGKS